MKKETLKQKVESLLIKWGNNPQEVKGMMALHFNDAAKMYTRTRTIAEYIIAGY